MSQLESSLILDRVSLQIEDTAVDVALIHRKGNLPPILFLHGFGSTKEDYVDIIHYAGFQDRPFIAYDAAGCGETICQDLSKVTIAFQVNIAKAILQHFSIDRFHLLGHSMGGLVALELAHCNPARVLSFINIKGNLAPEDCFLSRQISAYPAEDAKSFFNAFIERTRVSPYYSSAIYAAGLRAKVREEAVHPIFTSMVELSDTGDLLAKFLSLRFPRMYMYGNQYANLSYLDQLAAQGVALAEVSHSGHFPMYSNPIEMWQRMSSFLSRGGAV